MLWLLAMGIAAGCAGGPVDGPASTRAPASPSRPVDDHATDTASPRPTTTASTSTSTDVPTSAVDTSDGPGGRLFHPAGVMLAVPDGWEQRHGPVVATEFATGADCRTAVVVDREPPPHPSQRSGDGGEGDAQQLQTLVQVCATDTGGEELGRFLQATYGDAHDLHRTELNGRTAYRADAGSHTVLFTQTDACRFQIATAVDAEPALESRRQDEVRAALASLRFTDPARRCA